MMTFIGMLFTVVGLGMVAWSLIVVLPAARASLSWPMVEGVLHRPTVREKDGGESVSYDVEVSYEYQVGDQCLIGDRLALMTVSYASRYKADEHARRVRRRSPLPVYYDPSDPRIAVLEAGTPPAMIPNAAMGAAFSVIGLGIYLYSLGRWPFTP